MKLKNIYNEVKLINLYTLNDKGIELIKDYYKLNELFDKFSLEDRFDEDYATDEWWVAYHINSMINDNNTISNFKITFEGFKKFWQIEHDEDISDPEIKKIWNEYLPYLRKK